LYKLPQDTKIYLKLLVNLGWGQRTRAMWHKDMNLKQFAHLRQSKVEFS